MFRIHKPSALFNNKRIMYIACIKRKNSNFSALNFVIYKCTNVHKLEAVDLNLFLLKICYFFHFDACDVHNSLVVKV